MNPSTLLLVEDDAILALNLRQILEQNGYRVAAVLARGEDVAPFLTTTAIDLILMDIELSGAMTGIAAAAQVKHRVPVIFLTAFSQEPLLDQAKAVGPYGYLIKPVQERELVVTVGTALERCRLDRELWEKTLALEKSEANYRTLFTEMLDGFALHEIIVSEAGEPINYRFLAANPAFERMTGLKEAEIVGRTVLEVLPATESCWISTYGRVALSGEPVHFEEYTASLDRYFEVTAYRPSPGQFACIFADITEKRLAEEEKQKLRVQLQQAQKMEAIGTLAGGIAHDFNNILAAIVGYAEMARDDSPPGSAVANDLGQVLQAAQRAKELVKQILSFSRQGESHQVVVQPTLLVKETLKMLRSTLPSTITIRQDLAANGATILADPSHIHQLVMNLCANAYQAMEEKGGTLSLTLRALSITEAEGELPPGDHVRLTIGDTGPGIAPEVLPRIFDPFFTTKEVGKGTGMGLSIVHGIVKSCGGTINCTSTLGRGTVFDITLPRLAGEPVVVDSRDSDHVPGGSEHILYVDDEEMLRELGTNMLQRLGYRVTARGNSLEALVCFQNEPRSFDLVITDQTMPGMTGIDLARRMLQLRPELPIILCTGFSNLISEERATAMGIKGFAMKPMSKKDIAVLVRRLLDQRSGKDTPNHPGGR
jgi:PAS domain S-box-containing protein